MTIIRPGLAVDVALDGYQSRPDEISRLNRAGQRSRSHGFAGRQQCHFHFIRVQARRRRHHSFDQDALPGLDEQWIPRALDEPSEAAILNPKQAPDRIVIINDQFESDRVVGLSARLG